MDPNMHRNSLDNAGENQGFPQQTTEQERLSQPERMTGNNPTEINPNSPQTGTNPNEINPNTPETGSDPNEINPGSRQPAEFDDNTRHQQEIQVPDYHEVKKEGYAEEPNVKYIPEINGNEKYQPSYQDNEEPPVTN